MRAARAAAMASGCPAAFGDPAEVREGFLCPLCLKDLQAFRQLQAHYEEQHPGEDRDVRAQLRSKGGRGNAFGLAVGNPCLYFECSQMSDNNKILIEGTYRRGMQFHSSANLLGP